MCLIKLRKNHKKYENKNNLCSFQDPKVSLYVILWQSVQRFSRDYVVDRQSDKVTFEFYNIRFLHIKLAFGMGETEDQIFFNLIYLFNKKKCYLCPFAI